MDNSGQNGEFHGKVALVTGAARGQGRAFAVAVAERGGNVGLIDLGSNDLGEAGYKAGTVDDLHESVQLVEDAGGRAIPFEVDVRNLSGLERAAERTAKEFGGIDFLIAAAGIVDRPSPVWELSEERWRRMIDVNLTGVFNTARATVPYLLERGAGSAIVLVSSVAGFRGLPNLSHYSASKFGVRSLCASLANELGVHGIRCNSIHTSAVDTPLLTAMAELADVPRESLLDDFSRNKLLDGTLTVNDVTSGVMWLLGATARLVTGTHLVIDAGMMAKATQS